MKLKANAGVALATTLIVLLVISGISMLLLMNLLEDARSGQVLSASLRLFYSCDAGIEEARARLLYGSPSRISPPATPTATWAAYIRRDSSIDISALDPAFSSYASTSVADGSGSPAYTLVKIFYNTEANKNRDIDGDASLNSTTVVYLGDSLGDGTIRRNLSGVGSPIMTIQSYAADGNRREMVEAEVVSTFLVTPTIEAVVRTNGDVNLNGNLSTYRTDSLGTLPGIRAGGSVPSPNPSQTFMPSDSQDMTGSATPNFDVASYVSSAAQALPSIVSAVTPTQTSSSEYRFTGFAAGTDSQPTLMYSDRSVDITGNNNSAYGILVVNGNAKLSNLVFYGLIIASGEIQTNGGGSTDNIYGAMIAGDDYTGGGGFSLQLDRTRINNYLASIPLKIITYREIRK